MELSLRGLQEGVPAVGLALGIRLSRSGWKYWEGRKRKEHPGKPLISFVLMVLSANLQLIKEIKFR